MIKSYYVIRPKPELIELLLQSKEVRETDFLFQARVWERDEPLAQDYQFFVTTVKIMFLIQMIKFSKVDKRDIFVLMFGNPPTFSNARFDRLWTIERIEPGGDYLKTFMKATSQELREIQLTGDTEVDDWLKTVIREKEIQESK